MGGGASEVGRVELTKVQIMSRAVATLIGAWPLEMRAETPAAYRDEPSVEAFLARPARQATSRNAGDAVVDTVLASMANDSFGLRCWVRGYLEKYGMMPLQEAVDGLQDFAISTDLVEVVGQDAVQAIVAKAFEHRRCGTC